MTSACFCTSCRTASAALEGLPGAPAILRPDGGTEYVIVRKDRVVCLRGCDLLAEHRVSADSPTRRVVATCCKSFMFLDFTSGHWLNLVRDRLPQEDRSSVQVYTMVGDLPPGSGPMPAPGVTQSSKLSPRFLVKLMLVWAIMGFRRPKIDFVNRRLDAG